MAVRELGNAVGNPLGRARSSSGKPNYTVIKLNTPGDGQWTPPPGYLWMRVIAVGPGASGASGGSSGGGGGGCAATDIIPVSAFSYFIGTGGVATTYSGGSSPAVNGDADTVASVGGYLLRGGRPTNNGLNGGTASGGFTNFNGGSGFSQGGGGSGGTTSNGANGQASSSGDGGAGGSVSGQVGYGGAGIGSHTYAAAALRTCAQPREYGSVITTVHGGWPGGGGGGNIGNTGGNGANGGIIVELW